MWNKNNTCVNRCVCISNLKNKNKVKEGTLLVINKQIKYSTYIRIRLRIAKCIRSKGRTTIAASSRRHHHQPPAVATTNSVTSTSRQPLTAEVDTTILRHHQPAKAAIASSSSDLQQQCYPAPASSSHQQQHPPSSAFTFSSIYHQLHTHNSYVSDTIRPRHFLFYKFMP